MLVICKGEIQVTNRIKFANQPTLSWEDYLDEPNVIVSVLKAEERDITGGPKKMAA